MKKLLALLLCIVMVVGLLSTTALAAEKRGSGGKASAYQELAKSVETALAQMAYTSFGGYADGVQAAYDVVNDNWADGIQDAVFQVFAESLQEKFNAGTIADTGDVAKNFQIDMNNYVKAVNYAYNEAAKAFQAELATAAAYQMIDDLTDGDWYGSQAVYDLVMGLPWVNPGK